TAEEAEMVNRDACEQLPDDNERQRRSRPEAGEGLAQREIKHDAEGARTQHVPRKVAPVIDLLSSTRQQQHAREDRTAAADDQATGRAADLLAHGAGDGALQANGHATKDAEQDHHSHWEHDMQILSSSEIQERRPQIIEDGIPNARLVTTIRA